MQRALQVRHRVVHREYAFQRIPDSKRQLDEDQSELVAERQWLLGLSQIDRHRGPQHEVLRVEIQLPKVAPQRTGDSGHQHVVHGAAERLADGPDLVERNRIGPGDALHAAHRSAQRRVGIVGHRERPGELRGHAARTAGKFSRAQRMEQLVNALFQQVGAFGEHVLEDVAGRLHELFDQRREIRQVRGGPPAAARRAG